MFAIPQPSMALNAVDVPGYHYRMYNTYEVPKDHSPQHIFDWAATIARGAEGGYLRALVINCHGKYGKGSSGRLVGGFGLSLGTGIRLADLGCFRALKGRVATILITACGAARISGVSQGDGHAFCSTIAKTANAYVIAGTTHQDGAVWLPFGYVDDYEGLVVRYSPAGTIDWSQDYGRGIVDTVFHGAD